MDIDQGVPDQLPVKQAGGALGRLLVLMESFVSRETIRRMLVSCLTRMQPPPCCM